jgi:predicted PurR-regulated permease PerM
VVNELRGAIDHLQGGVGHLLDLPALQPAIRWLDQYVDVDAWRSNAYVADRLQAWSAAIAGPTLMFVGGMLNALVQTLLVVFTMFYLFRDGEAIRRAGYDLVPVRRSQARDVVARMKEVIGATVYGVIVIALIQGVLGSIIFFALGLPSPLLWGVVMFFLSMIPMAGAFLVWAPAALYLAFTGAWTRAVILVAWGVLVVGSIDNVLSPRLVGKKTRMHELLVFFSVLGGLEVFGVLGVVLGPVVVAVTLALIEMVREMNRPPSEATADETLLEKQDEIRQVDRVS